MSRYYQCLFLILSASLPVIKGEFGYINDALTTCGGTFHLNSTDNLVFSSPPDTVLKVTPSCTWLFDSPKGTRMFLELTVVNLDPGASLMVFDDGEVTYAKYQNHSSKWGVHRVGMDSNRLQVNFTKNVVGNPGPGDSTGKGFLATASSLDLDVFGRAPWRSEDEPLSECGGAIYLDKSNSELTVVTPEYRDGPTLQGPGEVECNWVVTSQRRRRVNLQYTDVQIQEGSLMRSFEGRTTDNHEIIQVLTPGDGPPTPVPSSGNVMTISYTYYRPVNSSLPADGAKFIISGTSSGRQPSVLVVGAFFSLVYLIVPWQSE